MMSTAVFLNRKTLIGLSILTVALFVGVEYFASSGEVDPKLQPTQQYGTWAFMLGAISAISLVIGSICGIIFNPRPSVVASLTAFGAGALLAALSVELIAPTVMDIVTHMNDDAAHGDGKSHGIYTMAALLIGCVGGGLLFVTMDDILSGHGGYMRKIGTMLSHIKPKSLRNAQQHIEQDHHILDNAEIKEEVKEHNNAPMSIWLGLLIDGIPESFVIGAGFLTILSAQLAAGGDPAFGDVIPYTLVAGLFLSNFPEALSSSIGMKKQGMKPIKILLMWSSLVLLVGIGALVGYYLGAEVPHEIEIGIEGLAAGAMLTMIAQTMIPEAVHIGGNKVVGLSTLIGYLSAVAFKLFE